MSSQDTRITVLIVDDHPLLREGVAAVLLTQRDMHLVGEAANGSEALDLYRQFRPNVTLMDLQMPEMGGIETIQAIRSEYPNARIIVLTTYSGDMQIVRAIKAGASGYLLKNMMRKDLLDTIRAVHAGRRVVPPEIAAGIAEYVAADDLSPREFEILGQIAAGGANKDIAWRLSISEDTVKGHVKNILQKLRASDRTQAVTIAIKRGIIDV
ncbi:MAG TPA: response regulator transcription factor [Rhizomicrobium sp.]|nr:response regulator transcription factor [Rhizomicrobium sp.]